MGERLVARQLAVLPAEHAGGGAARRRQRVEAEPLEQLRRAGVERVGDDERTRPGVQRLQARGFLGGGGRHATGVLGRSASYPAAWRSTSFSSAAPATSPGESSCRRCSRPGATASCPRAAASSPSRARSSATTPTVRGSRSASTTSKTPSGRATDEFARFAALLHYLSLDLSQPGDYARLKAWLASDVGRAGPADVIVMYLATSPQLFPVDLRAARRRRPERPERARRAREAARPRPRERAADQPRRPLGVPRGRRRSGSTTTSASPRCRT